MELLSGLSRDELSIYSWVVAGIFALVAGIARPRNLHWTALGATLLFGALNGGAGIYVLNNYDDPRWAAGGTPPMTAPSFTGTPVVGQFLEPLDAALNGVIGGVNQFLAFQQALPIAMDFFAVSGWALLVAFPVAIVAACTNFILARRRKADFEKYRATVDLLKIELEQVKRQLPSVIPASTARPGEEAVTQARPRLTR